MTADGEDIVQCLRKPALHVGIHRNWDKDKPDYPVEWKTGQESADTSIRAPDVVFVDPDKYVVIGDGDPSDEDALEVTDVMVPVEVYAQMVDALQRISKGPDRFGGYGPSPDGNQTPAKIAKAALVGLDDQRTEAP